jgi:ParB family chromosome partitioning protein
MKRKVLGKGIEAIIVNKALPQEGTVNEIPLDSIYPNPFQPRKKFKQEKIVELANSLKESGMIQPIVVFKENDKYYLWVGERRWRAAQYLKWTKVPAIVKNISKDEILVGALVENIQRENLNAIEVAEGIELLMQKNELTQDQAGEKLGMNRTTVTNFLRLLKLPEAVKQGIISGDISSGHARALLSLRDVDDILSCFSKVLKNKLSVRQTEALTKKYYAEQKNKEKVVDPDVSRMERKLEKLLATKVKLRYSAKGDGKIEIYFNQLEEFQRLFKILTKE